MIQIIHSGFLNRRVTFGSVLGLISKRRKIGEINEN
jgi:hypothetical protein